MSFSYEYGRSARTIDEQTFRKAKRIARNHRSTFINVGPICCFITDDRGEVENKAEQEAVFADLRDAGLYELVVGHGDP